MRLSGRLVAAWARRRRWRASRSPLLDDQADAHPRPPVGSVAAFSSFSSSSSSLGSDRLEASGVSRRGAPLPTAPPARRHGGHPRSRRWCRESYLQTYLFGDALQGRCRLLRPLRLLRLRRAGLRETTASSSSSVSSAPGQALGLGFDDLQAISSPSSHTEPDDGEYIGMPIDLDANLTYCQGRITVWSAATSTVTLTVPVVGSTTEEMRLMAPSTEARRRRRPVEAVFAEI